MMGDVLLLKKNDAKLCRCSMLSVERMVKCHGSTDASMCGSALRQC